MEYSVLKICFKHYPITASSPLPQFCALQVYILFHNYAYIRYMHEKEKEKAAKSDTFCVILNAASNYGSNLLFS